ncbi:MAG TPA: DNA recombination protein RmuC [Verrucomicrobiae bacterium]|nr:DNA recombination protein RmuC [Verrucomicrobiae bacterium]
MVLLLRRGDGWRLEGLQRDLERLERSLRDELAKGRQEAALAAQRNREETARNLTDLSNLLMKRVMEVAALQKAQLEIFSGELKHLTSSNDGSFEKLRATLEEKLRLLQEDNARKLEQMRLTVDEKLQATLEKRLGESFRVVSDRLEQVHKGLGEMQTLASGVGDLKKVLSNVKTRGTFGEVQLHALLEQILTPEQYQGNVATRRGSAARVEYAVRLPGREEDGPVWLPVDAKFPQEDYLRLLEAQESGVPAMVEEASRQLDRGVREMARQIRDKYLDPPHTTDFGIMFLPTEGLYAEVLRRSGLFEQLQREYRVVVTGPTTLAAFLNSLQMGFRTLAVQKRSSEVWSLLGGVKTEFASFGVILEKTRKKLQEASNGIEAAAVRTRAIERRLRNVQEVSEPVGTELLPEVSPAGDTVGGG